VDLSDRSEQVLSVAARFARCTNSSLLVLHVVHEAVGETEYPRRKNGHDPLVTLDKIAETMLEEMMDRVSRDHPDLELVAEVRTRIVYGVPSTRICEVARQESASMIIMGSHGRTGLAHLLLGSVAEQVLRRSPSLVTIVKHSAEEAVGFPYWESNPEARAQA
jgi:universal stress protein A